MSSFSELPKDVLWIIFAFIIRNAVPITDKVLLYRKWLRNVNSDRLVLLYKMNKTLNRLSVNKKCHSLLKSKCLFHGENYYDFIDNCLE